MGGQKLGGVRRPAPSKRFRRLGGLSIRDYIVRISHVGQPFASRLLHQRLNVRSGTD
jgi:hypothetical protein